MKIFKIKYLLFGIVFFVFANHVNAQGAFSDGKTAKLSSSQIQKLLNLKAPVAVPTYIPAGFTVKSVEAISSKEGSFIVFDYNLVYANQKGDTFTIQATNEGIGDHFIHKVVKGKNPYFKGEVMVGPQDPTATEQVDERVVAGEWIEGNPKYYPPGISKKHVLFYGLDAEGITKNEGLKIMLSLRYLKK